ncbi:MarR family winged helix-turn-helix transcriptional regulator [Stenotrophomonas forensis]
MNSTAETPSLGYLLADISRVIGRVFDRRGAPSGVTRVQWRAIKCLQHQQGQTQVALAELMDMEPIAVGRVLDRLQKGGFIERKADPNDRRCWRLYLTAQCEAVIVTMDAVAKSLREDSVRGVDPQELATTLKVLGQIRETLIDLDRSPRG